jgi:large repetitive protein
MLVPASALAAGSYTWSQPGDVSSSAQHGVQSWSYTASAATLSFSSGFTGNSKTLAGYTNSTSSPTTWIAAPSGGSLEMVPAAGQSVTLTWTFPFSSSEPVTLSGTVSEPNQKLLCGGTTWSLKNGASTVTSGTGNGAINPANAVTVPVGGKLTMTVTDAAGLFASTTCDETDVTLSLSVPGTAPAVTVTSPANGATVSTSTPTFGGAAGNSFGDSSTVTVRVYSGSSASGTPVQTLMTSESSGGWSVAPSSSLANGTYTVQAEQDDILGDVGLSTLPHTFTVNNPNPPPTVTLNSPATEPVTTATPTFTGTAGTATGDSKVALSIYSGTTRVRFLAVSVDPAGHFSVQVTPGLANGQYTAVAAQSGVGGTVGFSSPVTFSINVIALPSSLTMTEPAAGSSVAQSQLLFAGTAANATGDSSTITVTLYKGSSTTGQSLGTLQVTASGSTWSGTWQHQLPLGLYTAQASQAVSGSQALTVPPHTFLIVPGSGVIGSTITLSRSRMVSIPITCLAPAGEVCTGTVLVITVRQFQPIAGGPKGAIRLLFAYVDIHAGQTMVVRRTVSGPVARLLRHKRSVKLSVIASLSKSGSPAVTNTGSRTLRLR